MNKFAFDGFLEVIRKIGSVALWPIGVMFFVAAGGRISSFLRGVLDGRDWDLVLNESLLRPLPNSFVFFSALCVVLFFLILQVVVFGALIWRLLVLSVIALPILIVALAFSVFLAWVDSQTEFPFGLTIHPWMIFVFVASVFLGLGLLFGAAVGRFVAGGGDLALKFFGSTFLYFNAGVLLVFFQLALIYLAQ